MFWERKDDVQCLCVDWTVIGSIFPWAGHWAAALQGETMKTARSEEQARAYLEKHAENHLRKLCLDEFDENGPEFVPDYRDLRRRENALLTKKRTALKQLQF